MKPLFLAIMLVSLTACGGGGSSSKSAATTDPETEELVEAVWSDESNPVSWNAMKWQ